MLGRSSTNGLESINRSLSAVRVDHWQSQRQRWLATALLDIEPRLRKVMGYRHLPRLRARGEALWGAARDIGMCGGPASTRIGGSGGGWGPESFN